MMTPLRFAPGIIYDGRSIVLSVAGFIGGPATGIIAAAIAAAYRLLLGGAGAVAGVVTIIGSVGLGILFNVLRRRNRKWERDGRVLLLGVLVHVGMLAAQLLLPGDVGWLVLATMGPAILVLYSVAVVLISRIFIEREQRLRTRRALAESEERYRSLFHGSPAVMLILDPEDGRIVDANPAAERFYGWSHSKLVTMRVADINTLSPEALQGEMLAARRGERQYFEVEHRRADGTLRHVEIFSGPVAIHGKEYVFSFARDISERLAHQEELRSSLREKEVLLKEINHRVKNNLSVIASLLNLQRDRVDGHVEAVGALEKSRDRIATMAEIHTLLYETENFSAVDFADYLEKLARKLMSLYGREKEINLVLDLQPITLDITQAIPLALIVNEVFTNSLKHAFVGRTTGEVGVRLAPLDGGWYRLVFWDDGPGCGDCLSREPSATLGIELIRVLTTQLGGTLDYDVENGTHTAISFPGS